MFIYRVGTAQEKTLERLQKNTDLLEKGWSDRSAKIYFKAIPDNHI